jgi:hypothetical protein
VEEVSWCPTRIAPVTAGALGVEDLGVEHRLRLRVALVTRPAGLPKRRVDRGRVPGDPLAFRVAVLACRWEAVVRRISRRLVVCLMAGDAFGLPDRTWFMSGTTAPSARHADQYTGAEPDGRRRQAESAQLPTWAAAGIAKRESSRGGLTCTVSTVSMCTSLDPSVRVRCRRGMRRPSVASQS